MGVELISITTHRLSEKKPYEIYNRREGIVRVEIYNNSNSEYVDISLSGVEEPEHYIVLFPWGIEPERSVVKIEGNCDRLYAVPESTPSDTFTVTVLEYAEIRKAVIEKPGRVVMGEAIEIKKGDVEKLFRRR